VESTPTMMGRQVLDAPETFSSKSVWKIGCVITSSAPGLLLLEAVDLLIEVRCSGSSPSRGE